METSTYDGWKNYETWMVALHLDNDQGTHAMVRDEAERLREESADHHNVPAIWTAEEATRYELADYLKHLTETLCGIGDESDDYGIAEPSLLAIDMLRAALSEVDWDEIARNVLSEA